MRPGDRRREGRGEGTLTHLDELGRARMVDVSSKPDTMRQAVAEGRVRMEPSTRALILEGAMPKGDVLACARIAGIMAAKDTARLIPLCHPLPLSEVTLYLEPEGDDAVRVQARVRTVGKTGVEMEAMTAVCVAALTVYDMCKGVDRGMRIEGVSLVEKFGGRTGHWHREVPSESEATEYPREAHVDEGS